MSEENRRGPREPQNSCQVLETDCKKVISFQTNKQCQRGKTKDVNYLRGLIGELARPIDHSHILANCITSRVDMTLERAQIYTSLI